ncbi:MAG: LytTR family DNA-binding domain-containing protein [Bacteroidales bacterium]|jgi:two-component system response regulator LytT|nr:LytTR family DNA-binding domain-containing protein [Bacteroidales bacterium]
MDVLIVEDEQIAANRLKEMLHDIDDTINVLDVVDSVKSAVKWFMRNRADLIFLDIQLSDGLSFNIFDQVTVDTPVIFTTAYDEYAIKAFSLNSVDYLLKPIRKSDLEISIQKLKKIHSMSQLDIQTLLKQMTPPTADYKKRFLIHYGEKIYKIDVSEIACFFVLNKNVFLKTNSKKSYAMNFSLDKLMTMLDPDEFYRINRKMIVNIASIQRMVAYSRGRVKLVLTPEVDDIKDSIVSVERATDFKKWLDK